MKISAAAWDSTLKEKKAKHARHSIFLKSSPFQLHNIHVTDPDLWRVQPIDESPKAKVISGLVVDNAVQAAELTAAPPEGTAGSMSKTRHHHWGQCSLSEKEPNYKAETLFVLDFGEKKKKKKSFWKPKEEELQASKKEV